MKKVKERKEMRSLIGIGKMVQRRPNVDSCEERNVEEGGKAKQLSGTGRTEKRGSQFRG